MGKTIRGKSGTKVICNDSLRSRPVFTDNEAGTVEYSGFDIANYETIHITPKYMFSMSSGWCMHETGYFIYYSYWQAFKYRLRKILRLPVESNDIRDLVTWRRKKLSSITDIPTE